MNDDSKRDALFFMPAYEVVKFDKETGMAALREIFKNGQANDMNLCLFSTSGTHGSYSSIKEVVNSLKTDDPLFLTVLVIQPRVVRMVYGAIRIEAEDEEFLLKLQKSSRKIASTL